MCKVKLHLVQQIKRNRSRKTNRQTEQTIEVECKNYITPPLLLYLKRPKVFHETELRFLPKRC